MTKDQALAALDAKLTEWVGRQCDVLRSAYIGGSASEKKLAREKFVDGLDLDSQAFDFAKTAITEKFPT